MSKQGLKREKSINRDDTRRFSEGDIDYVPIDSKFARQLSSVNDKESDSEMSETSEDIEEPSSFDEDKLQQMRIQMEIMKKEVQRMEKEQRRKEKRKRNRKEQPKSSEVGFSICGEENPNEINTDMQANTGLVVICNHSRFKLRGHSLSERPSSHADMNMMYNIWQQYGCEVLSFNEEPNHFYEKELIKKIKERAKDMSNISFFVLVLSTHGEEKEESKVHGEASYQHYFYTHDGQYQTQNLINDIENIDELKDKQKMFFIQACRSRANPGTENQNLDLGFQLEVLTLKEEISTTTETISIEEQTTFLRSGRSIADARGYMPPEVKSVELEYEPTAWVPHCDDCIVMFASMSGKYAYSLTNSELEGGWLIKSLDDVLKSYESGEEVHILDILTEVNRRVANRETDYNKKHDGVLKAQSCYLFNISDDLYLKRS